MPEPDDLTTSLFASSEETETDSEDKIYKDEGSPPTNIFKEDKKGPPERHAARTSGESMLGTIAFGVGIMLEKRGIDPPVGRCIQLEGPLFGKKMDELIAHTFIDRLLQPLFRKSDDMESVGALIAFPVLVGLLERKPDLIPFIGPPLEEVTGTLLEQIAPLMKKKANKRRAAARSVSDINEIFDIPKGADPVKTILEGYIFRPDDLSGFPQGEEVG